MRELLPLTLIAATAVAAGILYFLRSRPTLWDRPRAPEVVFATLLALQLAWLAWVHARGLHLDVDTARQVELLDASPTLAAVVRMRGVWAADYLLQGPLVHALRTLVPLGALDWIRVLTFAGAAAGAWILRETARTLGATPWTALLAGLLPVASFGGAWLVLSLDDNVVAGALQWGFVLALLAALDPRPDARRPVWRALAVGALLGVAVSYHRKAWLFAPMLVLAPVVAGELRRAAVLRTLAIAAGAAVLVHALAAVLLLPDGPWTNLGRLLESPHHQNPTWWTPAGDGDLAAHAAMVLEGLRSTLSVFPLLSASLWGEGLLPTDLFVALFVLGGVAAVWRTRADPRCRVLAIGLAVQVAHSLLYEPQSVERWDVVVACVGVLGAVAVAPGGPAAWAAAWLVAMLLAVQHAGLRWFPQLHG